MAVEDGRAGSVYAGPRVRVRRGRRGKLAVMMRVSGRGREVKWVERKGWYRLGGHLCLGGRWSGRPVRRLEV